MFDLEANVVHHHGAPLIMLEVMLEEPAEPLLIAVLKLLLQMFHAELHLHLVELSQGILAQVGEFFGLLDLQLLETFDQGRHEHTPDANLHDQTNHKALEMSLEKGPQFVLNMTWTRMWMHVVSRPAAHLTRTSN